MKNSKEIANAVLQARDEHMEQQEIRNRKIRKISAISGTACALCLTAVGVGHLNSVHKNVPVADTRETYIDNIVEPPVIEEMAETPVIAENNEDVTNIIPSEAESDTTEKSYVFISDSVVSDADIVETPQAEVPEEAVIPETPQTNIEADNSDTNIEKPVDDKTDTVIQPTTENYTVSTDITSSSGKVDENDICHFMKHVIVNGEAYIEYNAGTETYTPNICLGSPSDYDGNYRAFFSDIPATLYTSKENPDILIVDESGTIVYLIKTR
ncbi:MAG: hypothetical protein IKK66_02280 [Ruminococcus sp.]|nr:hypothetical protein [Ruminococcus sp.]